MEVTPCDEDKANMGFPSWQLRQIKSIGFEESLIEYKVNNLMRIIFEWYPSLECHKEGMTRAKEKEMIRAI